MSNKLVYQDIILKPVGDLYEAVQDAKYTYKKREFIVPAGFQFDGASIPRIFWRVMDTPFHPRYMPAALPHDRLYETHEFDKAWADELFYKLLLAHGVPEMKARLMWRAVRLFGASHWDDRKIIVPNGYGGGDA